MNILNAKQASTAPAMLLTGLEKPRSWEFCVVETTRNSNSSELSAVPPFPLPGAQSQKGKGGTARSLPQETTEGQWLMVDT